MMADHDEKDGDEDKKVMCGVSVRERYNRAEMHVHVIRTATVGRPRNIWKNTVDLLLLNSWNVRDRIKLNAS